MGLIPIPQEVISKAVSSTKKLVIRQIRGRMKKKQTTREDQILQNTCIKMSEYVIDNGQFDAENVDNLINNMHRSIIALQKRKRKLKSSTKKRKNEV